MKYLTQDQLDAIVKEFFGHTHDAMTCRHVLNEVMIQLKRINAHNQPKVLESGDVWAGVPIRVFFERLGNRKRAEFLTMFNRAMNTWDTGPEWLFELCANLEKLQAEYDAEGLNVFGSIPVSSEKKQ